MANIKANIMKDIFRTLLLILSSVGSFAQGVDGPVLKMLTDNLSSFAASEVAESRVIDDGSTRITRSYASGEKTLEFKIGIPKTKEEFLAIKGELAEVEDMFQQMADEGKMYMESIQAEGRSGFLTFTEKGGSANGFIMAQDQYLIEINVRSATKIEDIRNVYKALDFSLLGGSKSSAPKAKTKASPKTEKKPTTEAEKKMIRMLTDGYASFKAIGDVSVGKNSKGISQVSRSYQSGEKTFMLKIETIEASANSQKTGRIKKLREKYRNVDLVRIDKEKLKGNLVYDAENKKGLIYLMVRGQHWMVGTINNASDIEDVKSIYQAFDYSLLK